MCPSANTPGILTLRREHDGSDAVLVLEGELDLASAPELSRHIEQIAATRPDRIVIDLSCLTFMDSSGLNVLIRANQSAGLAGYALALRDPQSQVRRLFELTGLLEELSVEP